MIEIVTERNGWAEQWIRRGRSDGWRKRWVRNGGTGTKM